MNISRLIDVLQQAGELFEVYGHAKNPQSAGLLPELALGLTALSEDVQARIAAQLARPVDNRWLGVCLSDRRAHMDTCTRREDDIVKWLRHYLNPGFAFRNDKSVFTRVIEDLERLR